MESDLDEIDVKVEKDQLEGDLTCELSFTIFD